MEKKPITQAPRAARAQGLTPSLRLVLALGGAAFAGLLWALIGVLIPTWHTLSANTLAVVLLGGVVILALVDGYWIWREAPLHLQRHLPGSLPVNRWTSVTLEAQHFAQRALSIELYDDLPDMVRYHPAPLSVYLQAGQSARFTYQLRPSERGPLTIPRCFVRVTSPLGLCKMQYALPVYTEAKVYPDFAAVTGYTLMAASHHTGQLGLRRKNRRGQGLDFHQLREYRRGDSLKQVSWKATAYRQALISKEYQDERDQNLILLLDSGQRMRARDGDLDHFDHALNALLLISHIALHQGDNVGVLSFGQQQRWIPPQKGQGRQNVLLNGLYDLQAQNCAPDYVAAAEQLSRLQRKRALVVLITNSRDEEVQELILAVKLLQKRHVVLVANLREQVLDDTLAQPVEQLDSALRYAGTVRYLQERDRCIRQLQARGVYNIDCLGKDLAVRLINSYWEVKSAGVW